MDRARVVVGTAGIEPGGPQPATLRIVSAWFLEPSRWTRRVDQREKIRNDSASTLSTSWTPSPGTSVRVHGDHLSAVDRAGASERSLAPGSRTRQSRKRGTVAATDRRPGVHGHVG